MQGSGLSEAGPVGMDQLPFEFEQPCRDSNSALECAAK